MNGPGVNPVVTKLRLKPTSKSLHGRRSFVTTNPGIDSGLTTSAGVFLMTFTDALLPEYDHEMGTTRRLLDRVPEPDFVWKPHEKSMSLGELSGHLANIPVWCSTVLQTEFFDLAAGGGDARPRTPPSREALLKDFDRNVASARAALVGKTDAELMAPWTLKKGTQEIFTLPKLSALRSFVLNHSIHHRGQLSVYLRLRNVALPSIYGPTADEQ
jgi:uncharacterized damage-inducible protein DinB